MVDIWSAQMADHCFVLLWYFPIEAYYEVCPDAFPLFLTGSHINLLRGFKTSHCGAGTASSSCPPWPVISACRSAECRTQLLLLMTSACPGFAKAVLGKKYRNLNALLPISVAVALSFSHFVAKFAREIRRALTDCIRRLSHSNVNCFYVTSAVRHAVIFRPEHRAMGTWVCLLVSQHAPTKSSLPPKRYCCRRLARKRAWGNWGCWIVLRLRHCRPTSESSIEIILVDFRSKAAHFIRDSQTWWNGRSACARCCCWLEAKLFRTALIPFCNTCFKCCTTKWRVMGWQWRSCCHSLFDQKFSASSWMFRTLFFVTALVLPV